MWRGKPRSQPGLLGLAAGRVESGTAVVQLCDEGELFRCCCFPSQSRHAFIPNGARRQRGKSGCVMRKKLPEPRSVFPGEHLHSTDHTLSANTSYPALSVPSAPARLGFPSNMVVYGHCLVTLPTQLMKH